MTAQFSEWHVMERIEVARLSVIAFVFFREDAAPVTLIAPAPAGVVRMTEDGRISGTAALCGLCPYGDKQDAQLDAITNSLGLGRSLALEVSHPKRDEAALRMGYPILWLIEAFGFVLRTNEAPISKARCGAPAPYPLPALFFNRSNRNLQGESYENLSGK
jgi:hypothetical protein